MQTRIGQFVVTLLAIILPCTGCKGIPKALPPQPNPLGTTVDQIWQQQEDNAEPAKFTIYMHEFELNQPEWKWRVGLVDSNRLTAGHPSSCRRAGLRSDKPVRMMKVLPSRPFRISPSRAGRWITIRLRAKRTRRAPSTLFMSTTAVI